MATVPTVCRDISVSQTVDTDAFSEGINHSVDRF